MTNKKCNAQALAQFKSLSVKDIISLFGGIRPMAAKLEIAVSTVQGWKERDRIPENRYESIFLIALENNLFSEDSHVLNDSDIASNSPTQTTSINAQISEEYLPAPEIIHARQSKNPLAFGLLAVVTITCVFLGTLNYQYYKKSQSSPYLYSTASTIDDSAQSSALKKQVKLLQNKIASLNNNLELLEEQQAKTINASKASSLLKKIHTLEVKLKSFEGYDGKIKALEKTTKHELSDLKKSLNGFRTVPAVKREALPKDKPAIQTDREKYLTLWVIQQKLKQKEILGGHFHQEFQILQQLAGSDENWKSYLDAFSDIPNYYFFSRSALKEQFYKKKQKIEAQKQSEKLDKENPDTLLGGLVTVSKNDTNAKPISKDHFLNIDRLLSQNKYDDILQYIQSSVKTNDLEGPWLKNWSKDVQARLLLEKKLDAMEDQIFQALLEAK